MTSLIWIGFVIGGATVMVAGHWYLHRRLVRNPGWPKPARRLALAGLLLLAALAMVGMLLPRLNLTSALGPLAFAGLVWIGVFFYLIVFLGAIDLGRLMRRLWRRLRRRPPVVDEGRRQFLARLVAGGALVVTGSVAGIGLRGALGEVAVVERPVHLARLPPALSGMRLVLLCDLHLGPTLGRDFTRRVVETVNALRADAVLIAGDLADGRPAALAGDVEPLAGLRSRWGTFFSTGNHEFYVDPHGWLTHLEGLGIRVLCNRRVELGEPGGPALDLVGVHDRSGGMFGPELAPDWAAALAGRDPQRALVAIAHQPIQVVQAAAAGVDLQLAGHTHGGQVWPFGALTMLAQPYLSGLHRHTPDTQIYVSRGTGFWGPPMRVLAPAEISLVVLTA